MAVRGVNERSHSRCSHSAALIPLDAQSWPPRIERIRTAVLPVADLGTRFLPATKAVPKEMLCVVDRPVVEEAC